MELVEETVVRRPVVEEVLRTAAGAGHHIHCTVEEVETRTGQAEVCHIVVAKEFHMIAVVEVLQSLVGADCMRVAAAHIVAAGMKV